MFTDTDVQLIAKALLYVALDKQTLTFDLEDIGLNADASKAESEECFALLDKMREENGLSHILELINEIRRK